MAVLRGFFQMFIVLGMYNFVLLKKRKERMKKSDEIICFCLLIQCSCTSSQAKVINHLVTNHPYWPGITRELFRKHSYYEPILPCSNVCFIKFRSKHSSNTLVSLLQIFMKQTLHTFCLHNLNCCHNRCITVR